ncbi:MAG: dihydroorotate dehydrogenase [Christensenellaceae bacterium]|nr:dihydroorotate dehydrogenase [Christensenellaceae bacterium]
MNPLQTKLLGATLKNPVIAASGTFGFGGEYARFFDPSLLGGISSKGLTLNGSQGNRGVRVWETPSGMLNSIGLENPGVRRFIAEEYPKMRALNTGLLVNLGGHSIEDYIEGAELLNAVDIGILELNISCPNVKSGGMAFGMDEKLAAEVVRAAKKASRHPLLVKLTPNAPSIVSLARACEEAGADGLSLVNTFLGMAIDIGQKKPVFQNINAGLSGPAILPIALSMVHRVAKAVQIPVVGLGGISTWQDALSFLMAGASAIQVGTATFANPLAMPEIIQGLSSYCEKEGLGRIAEIIGIV